MEDRSDQDNFGDYLHSIIEKTGYISFVQIDTILRVCDLQTRLLALPIEIMRGQGLRSVDVNDRKTAQPYFVQPCRDEQCLHELVNKYSIEYSRLQNNARLLTCDVCQPVAELN